MTMRIVQFSESFSPASETFIYDAVSELVASGVDCRVLTLNRRDPVGRPFDEVHEVPWPRRWEIPRLWHRALSSVGVGHRDTHLWPVVRGRLRPHLERLRPDVVHAQFGPMGALIAPITKALDIPLVVTFHGYDLSPRPGRAEPPPGYEEMFEWASLLLTVSAHNAEKLRTLKAPGEKVRVLHNGSRIERFAFSDPSGRFDGHEVRLLFVGRLVEVKSPLDLLRAFRIARDEVGEELSLRLTVAGEGREGEAARGFVADHDLRREVRFLGRVSHSRVEELMRNHHVYVQHCRRTESGEEEGLGMTLIEAQASGLPVISTRSGGIPEAVADGRSGFLVPDGDVRAMADRIVELVRNPERWSAMGRAGREHVEDNFRLSTQVEKLITLYREQIAAGRRRSGSGAEIRNSHPNPIGASV